MHLYQYLPEKFKAPEPQKLDSFHQSTPEYSPNSSLPTPREKNVSVQPHTHSARNPTSKVEAEMFKKVLDARPQKKPSPPKDKDGMPTTLDFSESTVLSEVTTPTVLTCPKIGPGYSDCLSVTSDLTTPTVVPDGSPFGRHGQYHQQQQQPKSMLEMPQMRSPSQVLFKSSKFLEHAETPPPVKRPVRRSSIKNVSQFGGGRGKPRADRERQSSTEKRSRKKKKNTDKSSKPDRDLTDRLAKLRMKSIRAAPAGRGASMVSSAPSRLDMGSSNVLNGSSGTDSSSSGRAASQRMEAILWTTVQQLIDTEYEGDFEEKASNEQETSRRRRQYRSSSPTRKKRH